MTLPVYTAQDVITGKVYLTIPPGARIEHRGVRVDLIGMIDYTFDKSAKLEFTTITQEKEDPGELTESKVYQFRFIVPKNDETYHGNIVQLRYALHAKIRRAYGAGVECWKDIAVQNIVAPPVQHKRIKMEVGIDGCLHIEFEYQREQYALSDVLLGKVYFLRIKIKIKHMELVLIRHETTGTGATTYSEDETIGKYEIMQGVPVRGQVIPVRMFLAPYELSPTFNNVHKAFSVRYYLDLVLIDEKDQRFFKRQEITLWRDRLGNVPTINGDEQQ